MDNNKNPIPVPAPQYISYVQRWITAKVTDRNLFPTDTFNQAPPSLTPVPSSLSLNNAGNNPNPDNWLGKSSGFPLSYASDIRNIYRQMLRCYAHIYHSHWLEFWHLGAYKELNTCFIHFVNVGRLFGLLNEKELEVMGPLVSIWLEKGWLPRPASSQGQSQPQSQSQAQSAKTDVRPGSSSASGAPPQI